MKTSLLFALMCVVAALLPAVSHAADPVPTGEPEVKRTVIEDRGARIEELRVRGQVQRITVTTKLGGTSRYEIITGSGGTDLPADGRDGARGTTGKSGWNVFSF